MINFKIDSINNSKTRGNKMRVFIKAYLHETGESGFEILEHEIMCSGLGHYDLNELFSVNDMLPEFIDDLQEDEFCEIFGEFELDFQADYYDDMNEYHECVCFEKRVLDEDEIEHRFGL